MVSISHFIKRARFTSVIQTRRSTLRARPSIGLRFFILSISLSFFFINVPFATSRNQPVPSAPAELTQGDYQSAIDLLNKRLAANPSDEDAERNLLRAFLETGRYAQAESSAKGFLAKHANASRVRHQLGEVYAATGRYGEAAGEFERAGRELIKQTGATPARLESDVRRAEMLLITGREDEARQILQSIVDYHAANDPQTAPELIVIARALTHLEKYKGANDLYLAAIAADPSYIDAHLGGGELFTEKYNFAEAAEFFNDALKINPHSARAFLGVAANKRLEGGAEMTTALARALEINSELVGARTLRAWVWLEAEDYDAAASEIERALKTNPNSLEARALRAALLYLQDRDYEPEAARALSVNPRYGALYDTLAHFATITRRYAQAAEFARRATELSPRLWRAHLSYGMALMRLGRDREGRAAIETAFKGDPFNVWAKNTLDLLDTMDDYRTTPRGAFFLKTATKESDVVTPYAARLLEEAATKLNTKYKFTPRAPIVVEVFPNHEDFAVRALGLPGLGALGVCFGQVIALDSPSARPRGQFNWGSTLWHEYTHVITLQMTDYRIPRWFSEGLSVYEERRARPGWGDDWGVPMLKAYAAGKWFKIADLDGGFQRPRTPQDVSLAYFQASQICEFITERYGFDAILKMLALYRDKAKTPEVIQQVLKMSEADFDRAFDGFVKAKAQPLLRALESGAGQIGGDPTAGDAVLQQLRVNPDDFTLNLRAGALFQSRGDTEKAVTHFKRAIDLFPYYTAQGNAYEALAQFFEERGEMAAAVEVLDKLTKIDENNVEALKRLARLQSKLGHGERALDALRQSFFIDPFDHGLHTEAGDLHLERNEAAQALDEYRVALALQPPNVAEANYNVARTLLAVGKPADAKRAVLRSLEAAPGYEKAQELLLKLVGQ